MVNVDVDLDDVIDAASLTPEELAERLQCSVAEARSLKEQLAGAPDVIMLDEDDPED